MWGSLYACSQAAAHILRSHSVSRAWERGHLEVSQRWRVNAALIHIYIDVLAVNSLLTVCTVWLWNLHPCSLLGGMISFIIICWLCLLQLQVLDLVRFPSQSLSYTVLPNYFGSLQSTFFYFQSTVIDSKAQFSMSQQSKHWSDVYVCIATSSVGYWSGRASQCMHILQDQCI